MHTYRGGFLRTQTTEQGTVVVKKPGLMRWVYTAPERKEFVSDGVRMYAYLPEDRQVLVTTLPPDNQATTPAAFLAGRGDIVRDFSAAFGETAVDRDGSEVDTLPSRSRSSNTWSWWWIRPPCKSWV